VGKKTDLFAREGSRKRDNRETDLFAARGEGAENRSVGAKGLGKKTDLFGACGEGCRGRGEWFDPPLRGVVENETDLFGSWIRRQTSSVPGQKTVDKKTDLFGEGAENGSVGAKGLGKKTDLFGACGEGCRGRGEWFDPPLRGVVENETDLFGSVRFWESLRPRPGTEGADNETDLLGREVCVVLGPLVGGD
jgi:hypothetical protein